MIVLELLGFLLLIALVGFFIALIGFFLFIFAFNNYIDTGMIKRRNEDE